MTRRDDDYLTATAFGATVRLEADDGKPERLVTVSVAGGRVSYLVQHPDETPASATADELSYALYAAAPRGLRTSPVGGPYHAGPNVAQALNLALLANASFNALDGERVAADLLAHPDLWLAAVIDRAAYRYDGVVGALARSEAVDWIKLRDLPDGYWNVDTLFVLAADDPEKNRALDELAQGWGADELDWLDDDPGVRREFRPLAGGRPAPRVLRVWWD